MVGRRLLGICLLNVVTLSLSVVDNGYGVACTPDIDGYGCESKNTRPASAPMPVPAPAPAPNPQYRIPHTTYQPLVQTRTTLSPTPAPGAPTPAPTTTPEAGVSTSEKCGLHTPSDCVWPFTYKDIEYYHCTGVDTVNAVWCSLDSVYDGRWRQCTNPCNKVPVAQILTGAVASGVALAGVGLITVALHNQYTTTTTTSIIGGVPYFLNTTKNWKPTVTSCMLAVMLPATCKNIYPCISAAKKFCANQRQDVGTGHLSCGSVAVIQNGVCQATNVPTVTVPTAALANAAARTVSSCMSATTLQAQANCRALWPCLQAFNAVCAHLQPVITATSLTCGGRTIVQNGVCIGQFITTPSLPRRLQALSATVTSIKDVLVSDKMSKEETNGQLTWILVIFGIASFGCIAVCSIAGAYFAAFGKGKKRNRIGCADQEPPYYEQVDGQIGEGCA